MVGILATEPVVAQTAAYSKPRGIYTVKVPGALDPGEPVRTYLGIQLLPDIRFSGLVGSVSEGTLTFSGGVDPSGFADPTRTSYVHVIDGSGNGFVADINQFTQTHVVCAEDMTPWVEPGSRVLIRPHSNLSDLLGASNTFGLGSGPDADDADNVVIWDAETQREKVYYFHSARARWEERGVVADAGPGVFRFPQGFYIVRRSAGTIRIKLSGSVASESILLPVNTGANVFSLPVNLSASLLNLVRTEGAFPVSSGVNATDADILTFHEPTGSLRRGPFYHFSRQVETGWREVGVDGSSGPLAPLDLLSTLVIRRKTGSGHLFVAGSIAPPSVPPVTLPPDPEPGEVQLVGEVLLPRVPPGDVIFTVEASTDLQTWSPIPDLGFANGSMRFNLPSGQRRAFYRVKASIQF